MSASWTKSNSPWPTRPATISHGDVRKPMTASALKPAAASNSRTRFASEPLITANRTQYEAMTISNVG